MEASPLTCSVSVRQGGRDLPHKKVKGYVNFYYKKTNIFSKFYICMVLSRFYYLNFSKVVLTDFSLSLNIGHELRQKIPIERGISPAKQVINIEAAASCISLQINFLGEIVVHTKKWINVSPIHFSQSIIPQKKQMGLVEVFS